MIAAFLAPYLIRIIAGVAMLAAVGGGFLFVKVHYENIGYSNAIAAVAAKDQGAISAVKDATKKVDECYGAGRSWDVTRGVCS